MNNKPNYKFEPIAEDPDSYWSTTDLQLATTLVTADFPVFSLEKEGQDKVHFIFEKSDGLEKAVDQYWRDELSLNPRRLFNDYRDLKTRLHS